MIRFIKVLLILIFNYGFIVHSQDAEPIKFNIPNNDWVLSIDLDEFIIEKQMLSGDSTRFHVSAINKNESVNVSIFIEKTILDGDEISCRNFYWEKAQKSPLAKENLRLYEIPEIAIVEFDTKKHQGNLVKYHSINAYLVSDGYWIDIHISKVQYSKKDKLIFDKILNSITIIK